ncbi:hypothetical protein [Leptolyngbya iicbica]|jgi:hypothetical protein|uniref:Uncharacterized protein n=2 Tax=Cyanophyceae TaxID=3028117 RepID=A0A4Q7E9C2_9CYAN|nr:hypothetical protein [Leptolyngbya sp. LK]RZM79093.1 hypothetical protein DYY88_10035 [Leptolyngbya sp. LK]
MMHLRVFLQSLWGRFPVLQKLFGVGWKVVLTEALIEIPFTILESSFLMRFLFGVTLGLTLWQYFVIAAALYLLIELGRWVFSRFVSRSNDYRFWKHELEMLEILFDGFKQLRGRAKNRFSKDHGENWPR